MLTTETVSEPAAYCQAVVISASPADCLQGAVISLVADLGSSYSFQPINQQNDDQKPKNAPIKTILKERVHVLPSSFNLETYSKYFPLVVNPLVNNREEEFVAHVLATLWDWIIIIHEHLTSQSYKKFNLLTRVSNEVHALLENYLYGSLTLVESRMCKANICKAIQKTCGEENIDIYLFDKDLNLLTHTNSSPVEIYEAYKMFSSSEVLEKTVTSTDSFSLLLKVKGICIN